MIILEEVIQEFIWDDWVRVNNHLSKLVFDYLLTQGVFDPGRFEKLLKLAWFLFTGRN